MSNLENDIKKIVLSFQQLPYLFVGTGMSMRYASAPSWDSLLYDIWSSMNLDNRQKFDKMKQRIEYELSNDMPDIQEDQKKYYINPRLATELQKQFNNLYYDDDSSFEEKLFTSQESTEIVSKKYDPFKYYICKQTKDIRIDITKDEYHELSFLLQNENKIAGVITTNYDTIMESIFKDFEVSTGQDNMLLSNTNYIFQIFKIHGSVYSPNSIVFTQEDYENFDKKLKYLSAKLLTLFVEHPIIFIGYSMGDVNILKLFEEISGCLNAEQLAKTKNNFIFITPAFDADESIRTKELAFGSKRIYMTEIVLKDYLSFYKELSFIKSSMPVKLARKLQDMVCNYVYSTSTTNNIHFGNFNSPDIDDGKAAIYFGSIDTVAQIGFDTYTIDDICEDVIFDNNPNLVNEKLVTNTFKNIRSTAGSTLLPVYKYLRALGMDLNNIPDNYNIIRDYNDIIPNTTETKHYVDVDANYLSLSDILAKHPDHILKQIANIKMYSSVIDMEELGHYLQTNYNNGMYWDKSKHSAFKRVAAIYDFKKYGLNN